MAICDLGGWPDCSGVAVVSAADRGQMARGERALIVWVAMVCCRR
jgi:hypothetical protein